MIITEQGQQVTINVEYRNALGTLFDPPVATVDIFDPEGVVVTNDAPAVRNEFGSYYYLQNVAPTAEVGTWRARFAGTSVGDGQQYFFSSQFQVLPMGQLLVTTDSVVVVRRLLAERIPTGKTEFDTRFTDEEILAMLTRNKGFISGAVTEGWESKAASFAELIDYAESGTERKLSQQYQAARRQADRWKVTYTEEQAFAASALAGGRFVGKPIDWARPEDFWASGQVYWTPMGNRA